MSLRSSKEGRSRGAMRAQGWNTMQRAHTRDSFQTIPLLGQPRPLIIPMTTTPPTTTTPTTPSRQNIFEQVSTPLDNLAERDNMTTQVCRDCAVFKGESCSPSHDQPPWEITSIPSHLAGATTTTRMSAWLWQDAITGTTYIASVTTSMSLFSLGPASMAGDHPTATLENVTDMENWGQLLPLLPDPTSLNHFNSVADVSNTVCLLNIEWVRDILYC